MTVATVGSNTYGGALDDGLGGSSLALTIAGTGTQVLSGMGSYTGGTIVKSGELIATSAGALPDNGNLSVGGNLGLFPAAVVPSAAAPAAAVPEPGTLALVASGLLAGAVALRRRMIRRRSSIAAV